MSAFGKVRRRVLAFLGLVGVVSAGACGWSPSHPLDRFSPEVSRATEAIDAGRTGDALTALSGYLATGDCDDGAMGTPPLLGERPAATYDLGLALFGTALPSDVRFGPRVEVKDEAAKKIRGARVACALRVLRAFLDGDKLDPEVRRRSRFLEGNLLAIDERYDESVAAYDRGLVRSPARLDGGAGVDSDIAWNRAVILAWREEAKRDAGAPDGGGQGDGGAPPPPDASPGNDASSPDAGNPDGAPPDAGGPPKPPPDAGPDAGPDGGADAAPPAKNQPDSGSPPDAGPPPPPTGGMSDDDLLDKLARAPTLQREAIRRQAKQSRGLVDK